MTASLRPRGRAMALLTALALMLLMGAAIVSLTALFSAQLRRTHAAVAGPQLRQLLLAAAPLAAEELRAHGSAAREVQVATPVAGARLTLHISGGDSTTAEVRVIAAYRGEWAAQTLSLRNTGGAWQATAAVLATAGQ